MLVTGPAARGDVPGREQLEGCCGTGRSGLMVDPYGNVFPCARWFRKLGNVRVGWRGAGDPTKETLELVRIALQAYGNGDCEIALALADPLIRWDERSSRPDGDLVWGHEEVERAMRRYLDSWEQYRFDIEEIAEVGPGKIVGICRERGRPKHGVPVDRRFGGLWLVEEGKIVSWTTYLTPKEAVRAAKELLGGRLDPARVVGADP